jgi:hypothetical protein
MAHQEGKTRFLDILVEALEKGSAVAVYAEAGDFQSYEVAFVERVDEREVVLLCLTPKGEPDGRRVLRTEDITRVDADNAYIRKVTLLYEYRESVFQDGFKKSAAPAGDLRSQLIHAKETGTVVHVVDCHDYGPSGYVEHVGEDYLELRRIGPHGEPDGTAILLIDGIGKVHIGRRQEQILEFLNRYHHGVRRLLES